MAPFGYVLLIGTMPSPAVPARARESPLRTSSRRRPVGERPHGDLGWILRLAGWELLVGRRRVHAADRRGRDVSRGGDPRAGPPTMWRRRRRGRGRRPWQAITSSCAAPRAHRWPSFGTRTSSTGWPAIPSWRYRLRSPSSAIALPPGPAERQRA